jgi:hypothetical protein
MYISSHIRKRDKEGNKRGRRERYQEGGERCEEREKKTKR